MNYSIVFYIIGWVLNIEAALLLLPGLTALIYRERSGFAFLITILLCLCIGIPLVLRKPANRVFYLREGFVCTSLSWLVLSCMGALPFWISGCIPHPIDALFETVSGFTTTGASILPRVEALPHCMLFWRSFTHWIGGMGVLVFLLILLPMSGGSHMNLMKAESPGPSVSRLMPKVRATARVLYLIYIFLTAALVLLLVLGGMPLFDSLAHAFGTAGTGGFGVRSDSIAGYSTYLQVVITVFMILFGINFNAYFFLLTRKFRQALELEEVRAWLAVILAAVLIISINVLPYFDSFPGAPAGGLSGGLHHHHHRLRHRGLQPMAPAFPHDPGDPDVHRRLRGQHRRRHQDVPAGDPGQKRGQGAAVDAPPQERQKNPDRRPSRGA